MAEGTETPAPGSGPDEGRDDSRGERAGESRTGNPGGSSPQTIAERLLGVIAVIVMLAALRATEAVTIPLAFSLFLVALGWPIQRRLQRVLPRAVAMLATVLTMIAVLGILVLAFYLSVESVVEKGDPYFREIERIYGELRVWLEDRGLPVPEGDGAPLQARVKQLVGGTIEFFTGFVLVVAFLVLGLLEVLDYRQKLRIATGGNDRGWLRALHRVTDDFQRYIAVRTLVGILTGIGTGLACWIAGLEFAFIWGLINFLLNYIPNIGSIIGVIPPTLFALVQFEESSRALFVLAGVGGVQLLMGNTVDPILQGRFLSLSPYVVLLSVIFWGWLWGVPGAFLSMPITVAVIIGCQQSDRTRWIAVMLSDLRDVPGSGEAAARAVGGTAAARAAGPGGATGTGEKGRADRDDETAGRPTG